MHVRFLSKFIVLLFVLFLFPAGRINGAVPFEEAAKLLPDRVGEFSARGAAISLQPGVIAYSSAPEDYGIISAATRVYRGGMFTVTLIKTRSDSNAYALLTNEARQADPTRAVRSGYVGTAGADLPTGVTFFKGPTLIRVIGGARESGNPEAVLAFARLFAETLDKGENEIPVLVKHLPDWEKSQESAVYAVSLNGLQKAAGSRPALDAVNFDGGTEAVTATYGTSRLVLVEYTTPQLATESDARITSRIKELRDAGQPAPSAYRRVGNYSVFVFDAPDEQTAAQLIDSVTYEQVVQWLGDNPRALERAQRMYTETTANIILAVIKASGLAVVLCLGVGGIFGTIIFRRRRAQQASTASYSDAGDMIRLNIDDLTPQRSSTRLLGRGDG